MLNKTRGVLAPHKAWLGEQPWISYLGNIYPRGQRHPLIVCWYYKANGSVQAREIELSLAIVHCEDSSATKS